MSCPFHSLARKPADPERKGDAPNGPASPPIAPPAPRGWPVVGLLPALRKDPLSYLRGIAEEYPRMATLRLGLDKVLMVNDPILIEEVLVHQSENFNDKSKYYRRAGEVLADGVIPANGDSWRSQRDAISPSFAGDVLAKVPPATVEVVRDIEARWRAGAAEGRAIDIGPEMMRLSLEVFLRVMFSSELDEGKFALLTESIGTVLRAAEKRVWAILPEFLDPPAERRRVREAYASIDTIILDLMESRRKWGHEAGDMLDQMMGAADPATGRTFDDRHLLQQIRTIILSGHEATGLAMTWTLYLLSRHPEHVARLLDDSLDEEAVIAGALARRFAHMRCCLEEAMRLYPPVWSVSREAKADARVGEFSVPKGSTMMICPYAVQHSRRNWDEPDRFLPDRFAGSRTARARFAHFPFIGGPRGCIGQQFAMIETVTALTLLVNRFEMEPAAEVAPEPMLSLRPAEPVRIRVAPRAKSARPASAQTAREAVPA